MFNLQMITKQRKEEQTMSHKQREKLICEDTWCERVSRNKASFSSHELLRLLRQQRLQKSYLSVDLKMCLTSCFNSKKTYNCLTTKRKSKPNWRVELPPLYLGIYQWGVKQFKPCTFWSTTSEKGQRSMERHWSDKCLTWLRPELPHTRGCFRQKVNQEVQDISECPQFFFLTLLLLILLQIKHLY